MDLPISAVLKRRSELEAAKLEDDVVEILTGITDKVALHGGTAIWRCYNGKRFSKDVDAYIWEKDFKDRFIKGAARLGIDVSKFREKGITFIHVRKGDTEIKVEPNNVEKVAVLAPYERVDGSKINVLVLSSEDLVMEKIEAYRDRKVYKDLYDITILLNSVKYPDKVKQALLDFSGDLPMPDEAKQSYSEFKAIIYAGPTPSFQKMADFIKRWAL